jgi:hypothetical protein
MSSDTPPPSLSRRLAEVLLAIRACPGRYHVSPLNQATLAYEIGVTDGWTLEFRHQDRTFSFAYQFSGIYGYEDEIWWGCFQDICECLVPRNALGTHCVILPPEELNLDQAEVYVQLRHDGMQPEDARLAALLL